MSNELNISLHDKQSQAFFSEANEILYGGAAGGGKSHLMRVAAILWCAEIAGLQVYLFRRLSDDLFKNHMEGAGGFFSLLDNWFRTGHAKYNASKNFIQFWNGSKIWLCHCQYEQDVRKYQGAEIHVLMIDELTHFTEFQYRFLRGRCRLGTLEIPEQHKGRFPRILNGSNPGSAGHTWVKMTFVDFAPYMSVSRCEKSEGGMLRQYIPALLSDNPSQDNDYADKLEGLGSPDLVRAMLNGDWDIVAGGAIDDLWRRDVHVIPRSPIPFSWRLSRSFDWGSTHPFSVGWWAEANGEEMILSTGEIFAPEPGSLIRIAEWYGTIKIGSNKGLMLGPKEVALGILEMEKQLRLCKWIASMVYPGPADNQISNVQDKETETIEKRMADQKVRWTKSDKSPGSRAQGLLILRERLKSSIDGEGRAIYFMDNCLGTIATLPVLPRDPKKPDDVDTNAEDHVYDDIRYQVLAGGKGAATSIKVKHPT